MISEGNPSFILTRLRVFNYVNCTDVVVKNVFIEQMSSQIRLILALSIVENIQELSNLAD